MPDLMEYLSEYTSWETRAAALQAQAEVDETKLERKADMVKLQEMSLSMKKVTEARNDALQSKAYEEAYTLWQAKRIERKGHGVMRDAMNRYTAAISRELTRRTTTEPMLRRNARGNP